MTNKTDDTSGSTKRRPLLGLLNNKKRQFTYALLNMVFAFMIALAISVVSIYKLTQFSNFCLESGGVFQSPPAVEFMSFMTWASVVAVILTGGACFFFILTLTHRFYGPLIPIRRQLDEMVAGQFSGRISLRKEDELHDVAQQINALSELLQNKYTKK